MLNLQLAMKTITLKPKKHREKEVFSIEYPFDKEIKTHLKKLPIVFWSNTLRCYYAELNKENVGLIFDHLRLKKWFIDYSSLPLKNKLITKKKEATPLFLPNLSDALKIDISKFKRWLQQKRLSENTVNTYSDVTTSFLKYSVLKNSNNYSTKLIEAFNYDFIFKQNKSVSYQNQCINGIKKYFEFKGLQVENMYIERPKKERKLPSVLSVLEIKSILSSTQNLKHKTLLSLIYSSGLRIGEALNLKVKDIDGQRMLIHIHQAKGKKDRYTLLSASFLELLRDYYKAYKPKDYLFEGQKGAQYTNSSAQSVLKIATQKAGIKKRVTLHTLRHSFATHLLENGTDIRYIQELLGHNSPKTTMIYTHVTETSIKNIKNPFDDL